MISNNEKRHIKEAIVKYNLSSNRERKILKEAVLNLIPILETMLSDLYYSKWDIMSRLSAAKLFLRIIQD